MKDITGKDIKDNVCESCGTGLPEGWEDNGLCPRCN